MSVETSEFVNLLIWLLAQKVILGVLDDISHLFYSLLGALERSSWFPIRLAVKLVSSNEDGVRLVSDVDNC